MPDEKPTVTVDLRDENEEWVQYARNQGRPHTDSEIDDQSLETASKRKLQQTVYQYLENLENNTLDISTRFELSRHQLLDELAGRIVQQAQDVKSIRDRIRKQLSSDEDVSAFELPQRTREATAQYLVEVEVGKAQTRRLARVLLDRNQSVLATARFETETSRTATGWVSDRIFTQEQGESHVENRTRLNSRG